MDKIKIKDLEVFAKHGALPEENVLGQKFLISAVLYTDTRKAGKTDDLTASIHYGQASRMITEYVKEHTYQLIERVAEGLAELLLESFANLKKVRIRVKKPWAPIGLPVEHVAVEIVRKWHTAYIALGSNIGNRKEYLEDAVEELKKEPHCRVTQVSDILETEPYGLTDQAKFLNGCLELKTLLTPEELLAVLNRIEQQAGRERLQHWGPRTLDLDIIFYDRLVCQKKQLCIPHVDMHNREFVLEPLAQLAPYKRHPVYGKTVAEMLADLREKE